MRKNKWWLGLGLLVFFMVGCTQAVAVVNGEKIQREELNKRVEPLKKLYHTQYQMDFAKQENQKTLQRLEKAVLEQMVQEKLLQQEAKKRGIVITEKEVDQAVVAWIEERFPTPGEAEVFLQKQGISQSDLREEGKNQLLVDKLSELVIDEKKLVVEEAEAKNYFTTHQDVYNVPETVRARHILLKDKKKAEKVLLELQAGADFTKAAEKYSEDPGTKDKGGDLGYFTKGQMVPAFEKAVFALKKGEISGMITTEYGYHIIKLEDHKKAQTFSYRELREEVKTQVREEKKKQLWQQFLKTLHEKAEITIYE